jgi:signal transduction histidine kinase
VSLRRRVFRYVLAAAAISCALTVLVAIVLVRREVARQRLTVLAHQAAAMSVIGGAPGALQPGEHVFLVSGRRPRPVSPARQSLIIARVPNLVDDQGQITVSGVRLLFASRSTRNGGIVLVRPNRLAFAEWRPFLWSVLLAGAGGALAAAILSWLLARRMTTPIAELATATRRLSAGEPAAVTVTGDDELAELGLSFNQLASDLAIAREAQRRFLESVSHELKTPLTSILGYAEALSDGAVQPGSAAGVIGEEARRLERLVSDLMDLARLQRAGFTVDPAPLDLVDVAARAAQRHASRAATLGIELRTAGHAPAPALADPDRLMQALSNLIENALRVTPSGGCVTVAASPGMVTVSDTGPGIASEDLPRAFERFYLHERYGAERSVGSGLGLAIVRELAQQMGGTIQVESTVEAGTTFTLTLPRPGAH